MNNAKWMLPVVTVLLSGIMLASSRTNAATASQGRTLNSVSSQFEFVHHPPSRSHSRTPKTTLALDRRCIGCHEAVRTAPQHQETAFDVRALLRSLTGVKPDAATVTLTDGD